jgi:hypothetical protein
MKKPYLAPSLVEYGSIADCTFTTPNNGGVKDAEQLDDGTFVCSTDAGAEGAGNKNYIVLQCDGFGEYSHS